MNADLLARVYKHYPALRGLVANFCERHEEHIRLSIICGVLRYDATQWFTRDEVLWMAAIQAEHDQQKRLEEEAFLRQRRVASEGASSPPRLLRVKDLPPAYYTKTRGVVRGFYVVRRRGPEPAAPPATLRVL